MFTYQITCFYIHLAATSALFHLLPYMYVYVSRLTCTSIVLGQALQCSAPLSLSSLFWSAPRPLDSHESLSLCVTTHGGKVYTDDNFIGLILSLLFEEARPC